MVKGLIIKPRILRNEINSKAFISGLEAMIKFSRETGREAMFTLDYMPRRGLFVYPDRIDIGNEDSMEPAALLAGQGKQKMGEALMNGDFAAAARMSNEIYKKISINYPKSVDFLRKKDKADEFLHKRDFDEFVEDDGLGSETLLSIHTHPPRRIAIPSSGDLLSLHDYSKREPGKCSLLNIPNFMEVIVGMIPEENGTHNILMMQEKVHPKVDELKSLAKGFRFKGFRNLLPKERPKYMSPEEMLITAVLDSQDESGNVERPEEKRIKEVYNIVNARYVPAKRKIIFEGPVRPFCETSHYSV